MKKWVALLALVVALGIALAPSPRYTEDADTVLLARAIYAMAGQADEEAMLAAGTVAMNRVGSAWFGDTLGEVLNEQHQFPIGSRYDAASLAAAHAVLSGERALPASALYFHAVDAADPWAIAPVKTAGQYHYYAQNGAI